MFTPQLLAAALRAAANVFDPNPGVAANAAVQTQVADTGSLLGAAQLTAAAPPAPSNITADTITNLITPHIGIEAVKTALGVAMREVGVANLPEVRPDQYQALYAAFQDVLTRFGIGGGAAAASAQTSII